MPPEVVEAAKLYTMPEDELLDRVDQTEREMHEMMKYLNAVDQVMHGDDLAQIAKMLDYTSQNVKHHSKAYSNIRVQVEDMNKDAKSALGKISTHSEDIKKILAETEVVSRQLATKAPIHEEDYEDEDYMGGGGHPRTEGLDMGNERHLDVSLQKQKEDIIDTLHGMNASMRHFSSVVEEKLQQAYKAGNYSRKFGYEGVNTRNLDEELETRSVRSSGGLSGSQQMSTFEKILHKDNKMLNRMQN